MFRLGKIFLLLIVALYAGSAAAASNTMTLRQAFQHMVEGDYAEARWRLPSRLPKKKTPTRNSFSAFFMKKVLA